MSNKKEKPPKEAKRRFRLFSFIGTFFRHAWSFLVEAYALARDNIERSIRLQLVLTFAFCLLASVVFYAFSTAIFGEIKREPVIDYTSGMERIDQEARNLVRMLNPEQDDDDEQPVAPTTPAIPDIPEQQGVSANTQHGTPAAGTSGSAAKSPTVPAGTAQPQAAGTNGSVLPGTTDAASPIGGTQNGPGTGTNGAVQGSAAAAPATGGTQTAGDAAQSPPAQGAANGAAQNPPAQGAANGAAQNPPAQGAANGAAQNPPAQGAANGAAQSPPAQGAANGAAQNPPVQGAANGTAQSPPASGSAGNASQSLPGTSPRPNQSKEAAEQQRKLEEQRKKRFDDQIRHLVQGQQYKVVITDLEGKVVFRSDNAAETKLDIHKLIKNAMDSRSRWYDSRKEFSSFYPVNYNNQKAYLVVSGIPQPDITYRKGESPLSFLSAVAIFIFLFYFLTQRKMRYIEELASGLRTIAAGNLDYRVAERSRDELGSLAQDMNVMTRELQRNIEEERRAERTKNELITNVSHDLRTPLTLIMGYLRLLEDHHFENMEQAKGYLSVASQKAEKLKALIDDLFEFTKLSNHDVPMNKRQVQLNEMLEQLLEEYVTLADEQRLQLLRSFPSDKAVAHIDADQMIRVFDNLLGNAVKYSVKPGVIKIAMTVERKHVVFRISNQTEQPLPEELDRLFERFYRMDPSRTSASGGSGLGLAIAKSIVEAHEGRIWAETEGDVIHFCVKLKLV